MFRALSLKNSSLVTCALVVLALLPTTQSVAATAPLLGTAASFAVLAGSTVTNTGPSIITGNLGVSPGSAVVGFPPGIVVGGVIHAGDAVAAQAQSDLTTAYNNAAGQPCDVDLTGQDLGGLTLVPGVYCFSTSAQLTGALTLNAQGNPNAVFIFQIGSTLTTASASSVAVINGGSDCNVFWQIGSSATLGTATSFVGNIMALASATITTGTNIVGRALARSAAVTLDTNDVSFASCAAHVAPTLGKAFSPATINAGGTSTLTITLSNADSSAANLTAPLVDTLPSGVLIAGVASNTCGGVSSASLGGSSVTLTGGSIPANGSCVVTVNVTAANGGNYINSLAVGSLQTNQGNNIAPAIATLTVISSSVTPTLGKAFSPATINAGGISVLTITLSNSNDAAAMLTAPLVDTLPSGVVVSSGGSNTCGGVVSAPAGGSTVTLTGGSIPANGSCVVQVNVTAPSAGNFVDILVAGALQTNKGNNAAPVAATLTVLPLNSAHFDCHYFLESKNGNLFCKATGILCLGQPSEVCGGNTLHVECDNVFKLDDLAATSQLMSQKLTISGSDHHGNSATITVPDFLGNPGDYSSSLSVKSSDGFWADIFGGSCKFSN